MTKHLTMTRSKYYFILILAVFLSACSTTKYVPEGDHLYLGGKVKVEDKTVKKKQRKALETDLSSLLRPKPNSSILGIRMKLLFYNMRSKSGKGLGSWISRKFGEKPVLFSQVKVDYNNDLIVNRLQNKGFFQSSATADSTMRKKKASMEYHARTGVQYVINSVSFSTDSSAIGKAVNATSKGSFLKSGDAYDLDAIKAERTRIDNILKEQGFYYFGPDYLIAKVDSTNNKEKVDIYITIKNETPEKARDVYSINNIYIFPNYRGGSGRDSVRLNNAVKHEDFYVIDRRKSFKPGLFSRAMFFHKGDIYNRTDHNMSLNRLVNLGTFKFVKNQFIDVDSGSVPMLDTYYYLSPYQKKSIRLELLGRTNSANFTGSEIDLSWRNRNTFKGAELLTVTAYTGTDVQFSGAGKGNNILRYGGEASLNFPKFVTPFKITSTSAYTPRTKITLGYDFLQRQASYTLNSFRTSFGYNWKESIKKEHQLNVLAVNFVKPSNTTEEYLAEIDNNPVLQHVIERQFTFGPMYNYTYTNTNEVNKPNTFYFNGNVDISFSPGIKTIMQATPSKFFRFEGDIRHYLKVGSNSQWATRLIAGYGAMYGGTKIMPYVKQFFIGGTNSLRGFRARSLGPGTYRDPRIGSDTVVADQSGDVKLEFNTEFRPKLFSIVRGAIFVDAGNIWQVNKDQTSADNQRSGITFSKDFMKELAVDAGIGLRFDITFLVLRTDLAFPLRKPWLPEGERWVLKDIEWTKAWRKDNLVFNLAIGYPF